jgi:hypothetical protein
MQLPSGFTGPLNSKHPAQGDVFPDGMNNLQCMQERSGNEACASYPKLSRVMLSDSDRPDRSSQSVVVPDLLSDTSFAPSPQPD